MDSNIIDLIGALRERIAIIGDHESRRDPKNHMARLQTVSEKIDMLYAVLPRPVDPQLVHFLQRRSYSKALDYLEKSALSANTTPRSTAR